ncbi:MAG: glycosyltransferase N-terminal domain-containing protein [Salibacteraceae bacterium]
MATLLYETALLLYTAVAFVLSLFQDKPRKWIAGRNRWQRDLAAIDPGPRIWFHCASVGEFEQARPVIEIIKQTRPDVRVVVTFFSPSGFESPKPKDIADAVTYLPTDFRRNARRFVTILKPKVAVFVKYELWYNHLIELQKNGIPTLLISAYFPDWHWLFRWPGKLLIKRLRSFEKIFVQDQLSAELLQKHGVDQTIVAGDTRHDRVLNAREEKLPLPEVERWVGESPVLVIGSNWPADDRVILDTLVDYKDDLKIIVAPHQITDSQFNTWKNCFGDRMVKWSHGLKSLNARVSVLWVDEIGLLARLYRLATVAYVGGGFGANVHNTLEAAVYGVPVIIGPNNRRFQEIQELKKLGICIEIGDSEMFARVLEKSLIDTEFRREVAGKAELYFNTHRGATDKIASYLMGLIDD